MGERMAWGGGDDVCDDRRWDAGDCRNDVRKEWDRMRCDA